MVQVWSEEERNSGLNGPRVPVATELKNRRLGPIAPPPYTTFSTSVQWVPVSSCAKTRCDAAQETLTNPSMPSSNMTSPRGQLVELPRLLSAAEHVAGDTDTDQDLRLLLAHGSSLGGARPKASVRDHDGHLTIAKFPSPRDEIKAVL